MSKAIDKLHGVFSRHLAWPLLYGPWRPEKYLCLRYWSEKQTLLSLPLRERLEIRKNNLADLLEHAGTRIPYWRERFTRLGIDPLHLGDPFAALAALPVLKRRTVQERLPELIADDSARYFPLPNSSGGSTGEPLNFFTGRHSRARITAAAWAADSAAGWYSGAPSVWLWGSDRDAMNSSSFSGRLKLSLRNQALFNTFDISEQELLEAHHWMQDHPPELLVGYASSVHLLSRLLAEQGLSPVYPRRSLVTSAETLSPVMRLEIEEVFGEGKVFNRYGSRETGPIGWETPDHDGIYLNLDDLVVELLDNRDCHALAGSPGRVAVTTLHNRVMPLIRFDLEDLAEWSVLPGESRDRAPRFSRILGRTSDTIRTSGGKLIHGEFFTHLFYGQSTVRRFQFVQHEPDRYELRYEAAGPLEPGMRDSLTDRLRRVLGESARIEFERCLKIEPLVSGKHRFTVSKVTGDHHGGEES